MTLPDFLPGYFHLVEFQGLRRFQILSSPFGEVTVEEAIRGAAEIIAREFGEQVLPGEVARVTGPWPVAGGAIVTVTEDILREEDDEDDEPWRARRAT